MTSMAMSITGLPTGPAIAPLNIIGEWLFSVVIRVILIVGSYLIRRPVPQEKPVDWDHLPGLRQICRATNSNLRNMLVGRSVLMKKTRMKAGTYIEPGLLWDNIYWGRLKAINIRCMRRGWDSQEVLLLMYWMTKKDSNFALLYSSVKTPLSWAA